MESESKHAYGYREKLLLTSIVDNFKNIIENKRTNAVDNEKKKEAWLKIEAAYNCQPEINVKRSHTQLKRCWENLKQKKRKRNTAERNSYLATGGGPPLKISKPDMELDELVSGVAPFCDFELGSPTDSTGIYERILQVNKENVINMPTTSAHPYTESHTGEARFSASKAPLRNDVPSTSTESHIEENAVEVVVSEKARFSVIKAVVDSEKNLRIQKIKESIEQQRELHKLKVEAGEADRDAKIFERDARQLEREYWEKKLKEL